MKDITSSNLLTVVSSDSTEQGSDLAFYEFHKRYAQFIWEWAYRCAFHVDRINAKAIAIHIMQNTLIDVHKNAGKFLKSEVKSDNDSVKSWLVGIIKMKKLQFIDQNNKQKLSVVYLDTIDERKYPEKNKALNALDPLCYNQQRLNKALNILSDRDRDILLTWYNFANEIGENIMVSKEIKQQLAKQYNLRPESLKKVVSRAIQKLRSNLQVNK